MTWRRGRGLARGPLRVDFAAALLGRVERLGWSLAVVVLLASGAARADAEPILLEYRRGPGCPDRAEFIEQVRARTSKADFVEGTPGARLFIVSSSAEDGHAVGSVTIGEAGSAGAPRLVSGKTCSDVVSALALILALAIDPRASSAPSPAPAAPRQTPAPTNNAAPATAPAPPTESAPRSLPSSEPAPAGARWGIVGAHLDGSLGLDAQPIPLVGASAFFEAGTMLSGPWVFALRASGSYAASPTLHASQGSARFTAWTGGLDLCPLRLAPADRWFIEPCMGFEAGQLYAEGIGDSSIVHTTAANRPWLAVREVARAGLAIGDRWQLELDLALVQPLLSYAFRFETPSVEIARVSRVGAKASFGVGMHFW
jgi:hypothetical protein